MRRRGTSGGVRTGEELALVDADDVAAVRRVQGLGEPLRCEGAECLPRALGKQDAHQRIEGRRVQNIGRTEVDLAGDGWDTDTVVG